MIRFQVIGETPSKKNSRIFLKNGRNIPSKRYQEWHKQAREQIFAQGLLQNDLNSPTRNLPQYPITSEVTIKLTFYHGDLRRRDSDNGTSSILDLLTDCQILADDKWQIVRGLQVLNYYEKGDPRCVIEIAPFKGL
jgi:Holliday junction resolvase RusA-like endonuclease